MEDNIKKWLKEWVIKGLNIPVNKTIDGWCDIEGIGKFKGLEIISEDRDSLNEVTINFKYDEWEKNIKRKHNKNN